MKWSPVLRDGKIRAIRIAETGQQVVRWDGICDPVTDWGQANWRLMLASPEMLAALEDAERVLEWGEPEPKPVLARVKDAIAKTRGENNVP